MASEPPTNTIGIRFAITTAHTGPPELRENLPATAEGFTRLPATTNGRYWLARLDQPLTYRLPTSFNTSRCAQDSLGHDEHGLLFLLIDLIIVHHDDDEPYPGMRAFPVDLAYVLDNSLESDTELDPAKIEFVGEVEITDTTTTPADADQTPTPPRTQTQQPQPERTSTHPPQPTHLRKPSKTLMLGVGAALAAASIIAGFWLTRPPSPPPDQPSLTANTTPPPTPALLRLAQQMTRGYPADTCHPADQPPHTAAKLTCTPTQDPEGPTSANFTLIDDQAPRDTAFNDLLTSATPVTCPGLKKPSPISWHPQGAAPEQPSGKLMCGLDPGGTATIAWTDNTRHTLSEIHNANLDTLYTWWVAHANN